MKTLLPCLMALALGFLAGQFYEVKKQAGSHSEKVRMDHGAPVGDTSDPVVVLRRVIAGKFAAKDTELLSGTELVLFKDQPWRMVKLRTENETGAAVFQEFFVRYQGAVPVEWVPFGRMDLYPGESKEEMKAFIEVFMNAESMDIPE